MNKKTKKKLMIGGILGGILVLLVVSIFFFTQQATIGGNNLGTPCYGCLEYEDREYRNGAFYDIDERDRNIYSGNGLECLADFPNGYVEVDARIVVGEGGDVIASFESSEGELNEVQAIAYCQAHPELSRCNFRVYTKGGHVYSDSPTANDWVSYKPRQHPDCLEPIQEYAESTPGVVIVQTETEYVELLNLSSDVYICPDGTLRAEVCEGGELFEQANADGLGIWARFIDWFKELFNFG